MKTSHINHFSEPTNKDGIVVKPFKAFRPRADIDSKVACPPYDVLSSTEAREKVKDNNYSFLHVNKPEITLPPETNPYDDSVYAAGRSNLQKWISSGWLVQDQVDSFYIYSQELKIGENKHIQYGLCCCVSIDQYELGMIKKHENTTKAKELDRTRLTKAQMANVGPVFLTYRHKDEIDNLVNNVIKEKPLHHFTADDGIVHKVWIISDENLINSIISEFGKINSLYVADGHHRAASAYNVGKELREEAESKGNKITGTESFNYFLAVLFPDNQLKILDYNRVLKDLNNQTTPDVIEKIKKNFDLIQVENSIVAKPQKKGEFGMIIGDQWYKMIYKGQLNTDESDNDSVKINTDDSKNDIIKGLDCQILTDTVLKDVFGIENLREDKRIDYVGGARGLEELEKLVAKGEFSIGFALYPVSVKEVMDVADNGLLLPPKATWFEPKLRSGLIVRLLEDEENTEEPPKKKQKTT